MVTIKDVAKHAKVGVATVSRVLNESGYVKEETRDKILNAIEELNYTPNEVARNLYNRKTGIVAVLVPDTLHPYFAEFVRAVESRLYVNGYQCMICNTRREQNAEKYYLEMLKQQRVDGVITGVHSLDIEPYLNAHRPIVALDRKLGEEIPCVAVNHVKGGQLAAEALLAAGCTNVLQCTGVRKVQTPSNMRHEVFNRIMEENGIICHNFPTKWNTFDHTYNLQAADKIVEEYPEVDGYFATDVMAAALIKANALKGRFCPRDYKIVGYDGTYLSEMIYPRLTTVEQPISQLAETCVNLLVELIQGKTSKKKNIQLDVKLRCGDSTNSF